MAAARDAGAPVRRPRAGPNPWLIAVLVAVATFMEVLDTTIANIALPYIAGGMGVSEDEASWVVTTYLVANAVILTASSFLARLLGRKRFFLICLALFTASSVLCGICLESAIAAAVPHPAGPWRRRHGAGLAVDPGGLLSAGEARPGVRAVRRCGGGGPGGRADARRLAGRQCVLALVLSDQRPGRPARDRADRGRPARVPRPRRARQRAPRFDLVGFLLVATFLGALEIMLDRGLEDDWFASSFIVGVAIVCALAFVLMIPWEMSRPNPMIDVRMVATRQFGACFLVMLATGAILLATTQFLPQLVQQDFGYTATWAGLVLSPGGLVTMVMMFVVGRLSGKVQPKYLIIAGATVAALSMYDLTSVYGDLGFWFFATLAHAARRRPAADLPADHHRIL